MAGCGSPAADLMPVGASIDTCAYGASYLATYMRYIKPVFCYTARPLTGFVLGLGRRPYLVCMEWKQEMMLLIYLVCFWTSPLVLAISRYAYGYVY